MQYLITIKNSNNSTIYSAVKNSKSPSCAVANLLVNERIPLEDGDMIKVEKAINILAVNEKID